MDFLLKQRLVGAVVLVALGVIFIPMLLEGPDRNLVPDMDPLPEPEGQDFSQPLEPFPALEDLAEEPESAVVQADAGHEPVATPDSRAETLPLHEPEPQPEPEPEETTPAPAAAVPETGRSGTPQPAPEPVPVPAQSTVSEPGPLGNWVVQMGSFSSEQRALQLRDRLRAGGFATQVEKANVAGKIHFRVRVGPYLERADAEREQKKMAGAFALEGRVLSYP